MTGVFLSVPRYHWCAPLSHPSLCMLVNHEPSQQGCKENTSHGKEVLPPDTTHLIQRPCYQQGSPCQYPAGNRTTRRPPDHRKETQTAVGWTCLPFIRSGQNHLARHSERGKKTRQTEEEVGRQHQGMDRPGVRQVPEGSGEQGKMEKTGCKINCSAPTTLAVKGLMMMRAVKCSPFEVWSKSEYNFTWFTYCKEYCFSYVCSSLKFLSVCFTFSKLKCHEQSIV